MEILNKFVSKNYRILEKNEAGIQLSGPEVKSCKLKQVNFKGAYCSFDGGQTLYLKNFYIGPYMPAKREQRAYNPYQSRRLLLKNKEQRAWQNLLQRPGSTIIPMKMYTRNGLIKFELGAAIGLKEYDRRQKIRKLEFEKTKKRFISQ